MSEIFVFGSNLAGRHGRGAALIARQRHGAVYGVGVGRQGGSYAIPTKGRQLEVLPLSVIEGHVRTFIVYAAQHPDLCFVVTPIGTGLAGYRHDQIAPMFADAATLANVRLPDEWLRL
jgi:hypothetical protein